MVGENGTMGRKIFGTTALKKAENEGSHLRLIRCLLAGFCFIADAFMKGADKCVF